MMPWADLVFVLVVVIDFFALGSGRLGAAIRIVAIQGGLLALLPLLLATGGQHHLGHVLVISAGALLVKGVLIPWLMFRAIRESAIRRELDPIVGFMPSLVLGGIGVALAFVVTGSMPLVAHAHAFVVPTAFSTVWTGLLVVVSRRKAVAQVLGFLILENGVFVFGLLLSDFMPAMVEAGVLLDLVAAVFVMGIVMFHIHREFSSLDTEKLSALKD
jgi:hydrogenase-4 component E